MKILIAIIILLETLGLKGSSLKLENFVNSKISKTDTQISNFKSLDLSDISPLPIKGLKAGEPLSYAGESILIDILTSKILYGKNSDKKAPIASLTKIMTAIIAIENYNLDEVITVPKEAISQKGATIFLREGEKMTVLNLLYGLLLYSGNDAAFTLASKMGVDNFVLKMNEKAKKLGLNINYEDPTGLSEKNKAVVKDLGFLTIYALRNKTFAKIVSTNEKEIWAVDKSFKHILRNTNRLLRDYPGTYGVKTGYTEEAQHCLIVANARGGHKILSMVLNHPSDQFEETRRLLNWVYDAYVW